MNRAASRNLPPILRQGRMAFVMKFGVLGWGVTTAVLFSLVMSLKDGLSLLPILAISLILFPLGGYVWGRLMWAFLQRRAGLPSDTSSM